MHPIFEQLKERKIVRWALAYLAGAVALYSALDAFAGSWGVGGFQLRIAQVGLLVGFFLAITLAWYHGERGEPRVTGVELLILAGIMGLGAIGVRLVTVGPAERDQSVSPEYWVSPFLPADQSVHLDGLSFAGNDHMSWSISPDGRMIALPDRAGTGGRGIWLKDLTTGGYLPIEAANGAEIFSLGREGQMMVAQVERVPPVQGPPAPRAVQKTIGLDLHLHGGSVDLGSVRRAPDGRFLLARMIVPGGDGSQPPTVLVDNFDVELDRLLRHD